VWEDTGGRKETSTMTCVCVGGGGFCRKIMGKMFGPQKGRKQAKYAGGSKWEVSMTDSRSAILPVQVVGMELHLDQPTVFTTVHHQTKSTDR
jgi:hypothetical protein